MNEDLKTLRRNEDSLYISGVAVLLFSLWDMVRFTMAVIMNPKMLKQFVENIGINEEDLVIGEAITIIVFAVILLLAVIIRLFIFLGARAESKGGKRGWIYIIIAALTLIFLIADQVDTFIDFVKNFMTIMDGGEVVNEMAGMDTAAASSLLTITSMFALADIIKSSVTVKRLRKKLNVKSGEVR